MEDVLDVYHRPYNPLFPVVCMDESPKQIIGEVREAIPMAPGRVRKVDDEYERKGTAELLLAIEPLTVFLRVDVLERRTKCDWARFIKNLVDKNYPSASKIVLIMDNLNTHTIESLYETFEPQEAKRIADRLEIHYTPKHGSWLNVAEIGFSLLNRQCLPDRVGSFDLLAHSVAAYANKRNAEHRVVEWQFTTEAARTKLRHLYPVL